MSTLGAAPLPGSDSEDDDYVPPPARASRPARATSRGKTGGGLVLSESETESAAADAFFLADAVPDHPDSDIERFSAAAELAPIPEEEEVGGDDVKPGGKADANGETVADDVNGKAGTNGETPATDNNGKTPAETAAKDSRANATEEKSSAETGKDDGVKAGKTSADTTTDGKTPVGNGANTSGVNGKEIADTVTNGASPTANDTVNTAVLVARAAKASARQSKPTQSVAALWREMNRPTASSASAGKKRTAPARDGGLGAWLSPTTKRKAPSGLPRRLPRLEEATSRSAQQTVADGVEAAPPAAKRAKTGTGLEAVLRAARNGDAGPSTLDRTKAHWREFKQSDAEVKEELNAYKKDKGRYTERVRFLERTTHREWEKEQATKKSK